MKTLSVSLLLLNTFAGAANATAQVVMRPMPYCDLGVVSVGSAVGRFVGDAVRVQTAANTLSGHVDIPLEREHALRLQGGVMTNEISRTPSEVSTFNVAPRSSVRLTTFTGGVTRRPLRSRCFFVTGGGGLYRFEEAGLASRHFGLYAGAGGDIPFSEHGTIAIEFQVHVMRSLEPMPRLRYNFVGLAVAIGPKWYF